MTKLSPLKYCASLLLLQLVSQSLLAASYYVNTELGDDSLSGQAPNKSGTGAGPWQTLAKVAAANLQPGDAVLFSCGQKWTESIRISQSGTAAQPITFGSWPANCSNPPVVDGSVAVPAHAWTKTTDPLIWQAPWPANLIINGNLVGANISHWTKWSDVGNASLTLVASCTPEGGKCLRFDGGTFQAAALAISNSFALESGRKYQVKLRVKIPSGKSMRIIARRFAAPWEPVGLEHTIVGTSDWTTHTAAFVATHTISNARLDFELRDRSAGPISLASITLAPLVNSPTALSLAGSEQVPARHPNGSESAPVASKYLAIAADSPWHYSNVTPVSNSFSVAPNLQLPNGGRLAAGIGVRIRSRAWAIEEHTISYVSGGMLRLSRDTSYDLGKDWGYFLTNAAWMLDAPGEWYYDSADGQLLFRPEDDEPPGARVRGSQLDVGIAAVGVSNLSFKNIAIRMVGTGVDLTGSTNISLDKLNIDETEQHGIAFTKSNGVTLKNSRITNTRLDAVAGTAFGKVNAKNAIVSDNIIMGSGVASNPAAGPRLPAPARAALHAGEFALVERNRISRTAYVGIRSDKGSSVIANYVKDACLILDDGGAIYIKSTDNNGTVSGNIVENVMGNMDGQPMKATHAVGIYIDDWTSGVTVSDNSVINADHGMQVHNAFNNLITRNTFYSNRMDDLWLQEDDKRKDPEGDVHSNVIKNNLFVPLDSHAAVFQLSNFGVPYRFAQYTSNTYSLLLSPLVATEAWPDAEGIMRYTSYTLPQWQGMSFEGVPRNLDAGARAITLQNYAQYTIEGGNAIGGDSIAENYDSWRTWNSGVSDAVLSRTTCTSARCMRLVPGSTDTLLISPNFSILKDKWYRLTFDLKTTITGQSVKFLVRRGGGGDSDVERYKSLMGAQGIATGTTSWKRHVYVFKAQDSAIKGDPSLGNLGARLDFGFIPSGMPIDIASVELVPITSVEATTQLGILSNPTDVSAAKPCPIVNDTAGLCGKFVTIESQSAIQWPFSVPAHSTQVIFTRDAQLIDSDNDGIANSQDVCPSTAVGLGVNARGCQM